VRSRAGSWKVYFTSPERTELGDALHFGAWHSRQRRDVNWLAMCLHIDMGFMSTKAGLEGRRSRGAYDRAVSAYGSESS
jgi:hypothetical protein